MNRRTTLIERRFEELRVQAHQIPVTGSQVRTANAESFYAWATSAVNLFTGVFGPDSPHTAHLRAEMERINNNFISERHLEACRGLFLGAKADFDGGYMFDVEVTISGEVFGDLVAAAKAALDQGYFTVAAVLASAALEDALKRYCMINDIDVTNRTMTDLVNALKSKGLVSGAQQSLLDAMPKIRDYAMHAQWEKLTPQDAGSVIGYVEQFLLTHFQ